MERNPRAEAIYELVKKKLEEGEIPPARFFGGSPKSLCTAIGMLHYDYEKLIDLRTGEDGVTKVNLMEIADVINRTSSILKWFVGILADNDQGE